jgi:hypothetical protein
VRAVLALALVAAFAALLVLTLQSDDRVRGVIPAGSSALVVFDLSTSIDPLAYRRIDATLRRIADAGEPFGLIFFSDVAYEAVPPRTKGAELRSLLRFFKPTRQRRPRITPRGPERPPPSPWSGSFRGGTRISTGLALARRVLARDHVRGGVVLLLSDLDDAPSDLPQLSHVLIDYERERIPLRIVALPPGYYQDRQYFLRLLRRPAFVSDPELGIRGAARVEGASRRRSATPLVVAALALSALLAVGSVWVGLTLSYVVPTLPPSTAVVGTAAVPFLLAGTLRTRFGGGSVPGSRYEPGSDATTRVPVAFHDA